MRERALLHRRPWLRRETGFLRNHKKLASGRKGVMARNTRNKECKPPHPHPVIPHGMRTQFQSNARLKQTETEGLALLTALGVTVSLPRLKFG